MYPPKFDYHRAGSVQEALTLMAQNPDAKLLAGGHSLLPVMKLRLSDPGALIDIGRIAELKGITRENGGHRIGALTTHAMVAANTDLPAILPEAASWIGDPMVRNRGTVGGNVAHADPASDLPTVFIALGATMHIAGANGRRSVSAEEFFTGLYETALGEDEILVAVDVPADPTAATGSAYTKLFNPASRYAMVGAGVRLQLDRGQVCQKSTIAIGGLTTHAMRCPSVEAALRNQTLTPANIKAAAAEVANDLPADVMGDIHAGEEYRRAMAPVFVARAIAKAFERANDG